MASSRLTKEPIRRSGWRLGRVDISLYRRRHFLDLIFYRKGHPFIAVFLVCLHYTLSHLTDRHGISSLSKVGYCRPSLSVGVGTLPGMSSPSHVAHHSTALDRDEFLQHQTHTQLHSWRSYSVHSVDFLLDNWRLAALFAVALFGLLGVQFVLCQP